MFVVVQDTSPDEVGVVLAAMVPVGGSADFAAQLFASEPQSTEDAEVFRDGWLYRASIPEPVFLFSAPIVALRRIRPATIITAQPAAVSGTGAVV